MDLSISKLRPLSKGKREQRGQGVVEFALVLPILALLFAGIIDVTNGYQAYVSLTNAARDGAAYGAYHPENAGGICLRAQNALPPNISIACPSAVTVTYPGLTGVSTCPANDPNVGCPIRVKVTFTLPTFFGAVLGFDTMTLAPYIDMMIISSN